MNKKLFGIFSGTHLTILGLGAMLVPSALYGADAFTRVVIQDTAGRLAFITGGKLNVYDQVGDTLAGYASNPLNFVKAEGSCSSGNNGSTVYTPPNGKALIVTSANLTFFNATAGNDNYAYLESGIYFAGVENADTAGTNSATLGNGYYSTSPITIVCGASGTYLASITGYLVPSTVAPAPAAQQASRSGPAVTKNGRTF